MKTKDDIAEKVECLKRLSLFKAVVDNDAALSEVAGLLDTQKYSKGEAVVEENADAGDMLFIIKSGTVEIQKRTMQGDSYTVADLSAEMNIFFGEVALLDPDRRSATVRCKTDCTFYVLHRQQFIEYGNENPYVGLMITRELSRILCSRLRKANTDMLTLFDALVEEVEMSGGIA